MSSFSFPFCILMFLAVALVDATHAEVQNFDVDANLKLLTDPDMNKRIQALRELQYSLDLRIPEACLPLLRDEGDSTRRIAARAIGSRWHQIARDRISEFVRALEWNKASEHPPEQWMARRAIGLLNRNYKDETFSPSANERWVIYERYRSPCLIDTTTETEELLGWTPDEEVDQRPWFHGDSNTKSKAVWHPESEMVALDLATSRRSSTIWIWRHQKGILQISPEDVAKVLSPEGKNEFVSSQILKIVRWNDDELVFSFESFMTGADSEGDVMAILACNVETEEIRKISMTLGE